MDILPKHKSDKLIITLMFTLIISMVSATMFNIVLPKISEEFSLTTSQVSWITSIYILIFAIGTVTYGKLADTYKLKNLLTFGLFLCAIGSIIGLSAQTYAMILIGRSIQAIGASVSPATSMLIPVRYFPPEKRGRALGIASVGIALGSAVGPIVSAFIVSVFHWRWLFCLPLLFLFTVPFYRKYLGDEQQKMGKFDWIGGGLLGATVALLMLSVTSGRWLYVFCGLLMMNLFVIRIRFSAEPFIRPELFKNKRYTLGLIISFLVNGTGYSLYFLSPLLLSDVNKLASGLIGFLMVPAAITAAFLGLKGGKLADTKGNSYLFYIASVLLLICFLLLSSFVGISSLVISIFLIIGNVGQSYIIIAISNAVSRTLLKEDAGVGMGLLATMNFISVGIAAAIYSKMVDLGSFTLWNPLNRYQDGFVYSNIYLILFGVHVCILVFYYFLFGRRIK
ncbi:MFS transporter [Shimazuella alba]|uniref:MFS transporter n=1 Tax=Shimazuella alba TaxID=2690964 RepID=A0A6I4W0I9_9BACL|nr:MFS transporter [Shimazuella alba]MXQ55760.1 MFS transporter [Shimazuella alba]